MARPALLGWWRGRTLRVRLLLGSVVPLALAVVAGTLAVTAVFTAGRLRDLDHQTRAEADTVTGLVQTGQLVSPLPLPAGSALLAQVLGPDGRVLAATQGAGQVLPLSAVGRRPAAPRTYTDGDSLLGALPVRVRVQPALRDGAQVLVVVAAPMADVRRAEQALHLVLLLVVPLLVGAAGALAWLVTGYSLRPVERLRQAAAALAADPDRLTSPDSGRLASRGPAHGPLLPASGGGDEIGRLGDTLNELLGRLQAAMAQQRAFVADAAHELRSPLASLRIQLDVAAAHPDLQTVAETTSSLSTEVDRLIRLTDDLLVMARLEARLPLPSSLVDLTELAGVSGAPVQVRAEREAVRRLVRNLTDNAERHAEHVRVTTWAEGDMGVLCVDDDGPGIPPEARDRVFQRWERLDRDRARAGGGTGLGLALVREIASAYGGNAGISDSPLGGARVTVRLPTWSPAPARPGQDGVGRHAGPQVSAVDGRLSKMPGTRFSRPAGRW